MATCGMTGLIETYKDTLYTDILEKNDIPMLKVLLSSTERSNENMLQYAQSAEAVTLILDAFLTNKISEKIGEKEQSKEEEGVVSSTIDFTNSISEGFKEKLSYILLCNPLLSNNQKEYVREYILKYLNSNTNGVAGNGCGINPNFMLGTEPLWHFIRVFESKHFSEPIQKNIQDLKGRTYLHKIEHSLNDNEFYKYMPNPFIRDFSGNLPPCSVPAPSHVILSTSTTSFSATERSENDEEYEDEHTVPYVNITDKMRRYETLYLEYLVSCESKLHDIQRNLGIPVQSSRDGLMLDEIDIMIDSLLSANKLAEKSENATISALLSLLDETEGKYNKIKVSMATFKLINAEVLKPATFRETVAKKIVEIRAQLVGTKSDKFLELLEQVEHMIVVANVPDTCSSTSSSSSTL